MKKNKVVLMVLLVLGIILTIVLTKTKGKSEFNKIELSKENIIVNKTNMPYLDTIVNLGLTELKIKGVVVLLRPITIVNKDKDLDLRAHIVYGDNRQYLIEISTNDRSEIIDIISHELIHLKQSEDGRVVNKKNYIIWQGDTLYAEQIPEYFSRPWEMEAFKSGPLLSAKLNKVLY